MHETDDTTMQSGRRPAKPAAKRSCSMLVARSCRCTSPVRSFGLIVVVVRNEAYGVFGE